MSTVRCKSCREEFSSKLSACPSCGTARQKGGRRVKKSRGSALLVIISVVIILALILAVFFLADRYLGVDIPFMDKIFSAKQPEAETPPENTPAISEGDKDPTQTEPDAEPTTPEPSAALESIALDYEELTLRDGESTAQLTATIYPAGAEASVEWKSSDPTIARVDENGLVTGVGEGKVTVYAYAGDKIAECAVYSYVTVPPTETPDGEPTAPVGSVDGTLVLTTQYSGSNAAEDISISVGESCKFYLRLDGEILESGVEWASDNSGLTVESDGTVTGAASGTLNNLSASYGGETHTCIVRVK